MIRRFCLALFLLLPLAGPAAAETELFADNKLKVAIERGDYDKARQLLIGGAGASAPVTSKGETPLILAAKKQYYGIMELLLDHDARVNGQDELGNSALYYAASKRAYDIAAFLLDNGADPNLQNRRGETPFMEAAGTGDIGIAQMMVDFGASFDIKDYTGRTAMDYARNARNASIVTALERARNR